MSRSGLAAIASKVAPTGPYKSALSSTCRLSARPFGAGSRPWKFLRSSKERDDFLWRLSDQRRGLLVSNLAEESDRMKFSLLAHS